MWERVQICTILKFVAAAKKYQTDLIYFLCCRNKFFDKNIVSQQKRLHGNTHEWNIALYVTIA